MPQQLLRLAGFTSYAVVARIDPWQEQVMTQGLSPSHSCHGFMELDRLDPRP
ncbi:MAG: hypothetical protein ACK55E_12810 [Cyanobacteriota bacterium]